jgi:glyoxylate reductase
MRVLYFSRTRRPDLEHSMGVRFADFDTLLRESDVISIHAQLDDSTRHMFDRESFLRMKNSAILINTARGPIVDSDALFEALSERRICAAALDVTDPEPIPAESPLLGLPNCVIVPHIASASVATRGRMADIAVANLIAGLRGEILLHCVNPQVYESGLRNRGE